MNGVVIADDLSGAAEIAGIAQRLGWRTQLCTNPDAPTQPSSDVEVWVIDTDSREVAPAEAHRRCHVLGASIARQFPGVPVFKKVDSVLRGHVALECAALAQSLGLTEVLLLPANPSRARRIRDGRYEIEGVPLSQTAFARDPHYPARTAEVAALLNALPDSPTRFRIPDVTTRDDLDVILAQPRPPTLVAGAADAFLALCPATPVAARPFSASPTPTLILNGSAGPQVEAITRLRAGGAVLLEASAPIDQLRDALRSARTVHFTLGRHHEARLREITTVLQPQPCLHLALTGGATARAICERLNFDQFEVLPEWAPGVARLRPRARPEWEISIKPGSYAWPASFGLDHVA